MDRNKLIIIGVSIFFFMPFLGAVHLFDWDEINFAEIAREMIITGDYLRPQINYQMFTEKPPMFMWMQALSMNIFGMNEYAARFPNTIAGLITLLLLYTAGKKLYNKQFGLLWAGAYFGSILPHLYFRSGIIDPWFNLFIFLGLYHIILYYWKKENDPNFGFSRSKWSYLILAGIFTGLGVLVKGPVAFLIISLALGVYWVTKKFRFYLNIIDYGVFTIVTILTASIWFGVVSLLHGPQFAIEFTIRQWELFSQQDAGHGGFIGYHFVVLLIGVFPASIFMIRSMGKTVEGYPHQTDMKKWMTILFWVVLILFSIVSTKIVHYSSLAYYPMAYLAALVIYQMDKGLINFSLWMKILIGFIAFVFGIAVIALPWLGMHIEILKELAAADPFAVANMDAEINWTGLEALPGIWLIVITIAGMVLISQNKTYKGIIWLFGGTGVFVFLTLTLVITKIEAITQNAAIEFYKTKVDCDCYVVSEEYKSYAQLFYTKIPPHTNPNRLSKEWLKTGDIDKDVFFVAKITGTQYLEKLPDVELLYEKNGFTFWHRKAIK
ncbi:glycosyltransferase family 39 protein [bacterium SCSIO 12643]|nr:glycosyltransferase family 39 protein [bacterium SCSIO 12643]